MDAVGESAGRYKTALGSFEARHRDFHLTKLTLDGTEPCPLRVELRLEPLPLRIDTTDDPGSQTERGTAERDQERCRADHDRENFG
jgi:hypothetical protein